MEQSEQKFLRISAIRLRGRRQTSSMSWHRWRNASIGAKMTLAPVSCRRSPPFCGDILADTSVIVLYTLFHASQAWILSSSASLLFSTSPSSMFSNPMPAEHLLMISLLTCKKFERAEKWDAWRWFVPIPWTTNDLRYVWYIEWKNNWIGLTLHKSPVIFSEVL